jgi:hypothetical protein
MIRPLRRQHGWWAAFLLVGGLVALAAALAVRS